MLLHRILCWLFMELKCARKVFRRTKVSLKWKYIILFLFRYILNVELHFIQDEILTIGILQCMKYLLSSCLFDILLSQPFTFWFTMLKNCLVLVSSNLKVLFLTNKLFFLLSNSRINRWNGYSEIHKYLFHYVIISSVVNWVQQNLNKIEKVVQNNIKKK